MSIVLVLMFGSAVDSGEKCEKGNWHFRLSQTDAQNTMVRLQSRSSLLSLLHVPSYSNPSVSLQSAVEEALERIKGLKGVEG
jgi:hypothetical protein